MFSILESALELREQGFSIIPVIHKQPAIMWQPYMERLPTCAELESWFNGKFQKYAIVTGRISGVVAVDCDGPAAIEFADRMLPPTPMRSRTPRGGEHRYYDTSEVVRNGVKLNGMALDIRGEKGICVEYGQGYERLGDWEAPRPRFDIEWIKRESDVAAVKMISPGEFQSENVDSLIRYIGQIRSVSGQRGHDSCFRCACKIAEAGLSWEESLRVFAWWNSCCASPQWSRVELLHKMTDAFKTKGR